MSNIAPDPDNPVTLDDKVIERLRQDMGDDANMVIDSYLESIDQFLGDFENRDMRTSNDDLHRWAHTIKSSASSIGAMRLAQLAEQLEDSYRNQVQIDLAEKLQVMQREYRVVFDSLDKVTRS